MSEADELIRKRAAKTLPATSDEASHQPSRSEEATESNSRSAAEAGSGIRLRRLSDLPEEKVKWIWRDRLPRGKVVVLEGHPGVGKSTLTAAIAAAVTAAVTLADEAVDSKGDVVFLTYEDGLADTILPRVLAAGGNPSRIIIPDINRREGESVALTIPDHLAALERKLEMEGIRPDVVIIDPLTAALNSDVDSYRDQDVRRALAQVAAFAERTGACVVLVRHLKKQSSGTAISRGSGSIAIGAAARVVLGVYHHPEHADRRLLAVVKSNLAKMAPTLAFELVSSPRSDEDVPVIRWLGEDSWTAQALEERQALDAPRRRSAAQSWLETLLSDGPMHSREVHRLAKEAGFSSGQIERAAVALNVLKTTSGFAAEKRSHWSLPERATEDHALTPRATEPTEPNAPSPNSSNFLNSSNSPVGAVPGTSVEESPRVSISSESPSEKPREMEELKEMVPPECDRGLGSNRYEKTDAALLNCESIASSHADRRWLADEQLRSLAFLLWKRGIGLSVDAGRLVLDRPPGDLVSTIQCARERLIAVLTSGVLATAFGRPVGLSQSPSEKTRVLWLLSESETLTEEELSRLRGLEERRLRRDSSHWEARMLALEELLRERES